MNNYPIATILGGGGFIGRYLVRNLTNKNYRCIIPTRNAFQKGYLKTQAPPGAIEFIDWKNSDFSKIKEAINTSDVVINLIGILYENRKQKFVKIHADIPDIIAKICAESDVKKFIQVSAIGASENSSSFYQRSKFQGETKALNNFKNTVIIRPSVVCGTEDNFTNLFSRLSFLPVIPIVGINANANVSSVVISSSGFFVMSGQEINSALANIIPNSNNNINMTGLQANVIPTDLRFWEPIVDNNTENWTNI